MRIIAGSARGRRLATPQNLRVRPTADRVKEALFNILSSFNTDFSSLHVLDLFSGTGNLGIEALSRGAAHAVLVDNHRDSIRLIRQNLENLGFSAQARVLACDANAAITKLDRGGESFQLIFLDPPYGTGLLEQTLDLIGKSRLVTEESTVVAEFSVKEQVPSCFGNLEEFDRRVYGDTVISFLNISPARL